MNGEDPLARCYDAHAQALFGYLLSQTRQPEDARDLLQETFLRLARQPELLAAARSERAVLFRIAHNLAMDLHRRQKFATVWPRSRRLATRSLLHPRPILMKRRSGRKRLRPWENCRRNNGL